MSIDGQCEKCGDMNGTLWKFPGDIILGLCTKCRNKAVCYIQTSDAFRDFRAASLIADNNCWRTTGKNNSYEEIAGAAFDVVDELLRAEESLRSLLLLWAGKEFEMD